MASLYLGLDGGQSSTKALIAGAEGRILGYGTAGPCNHVSGADAGQKFVAAIGRCLERACAEAQLEASDVAFAAACLGFSGGAEDKEVYARQLIRAQKYKITHDAEIALSGATEGRPGIIVIAGTGAMAFGRNGMGKTARAGGWGYIFGDEGSAFDIVRQALRAALKAEEGWGPPTIIRERLLSATGARTANDLLHAFYTDEFPRDRVAAFAPLIKQAAAAGDNAASTILRDGARDLASLARGVHEQLFEEFEPVPVCYSGGVFRSEEIRVAFSNDVREAIGCDVSSPRYSPVAGAVLDALRLDGNQAELSNVPGEHSIL